MNDIDLRLSKRLKSHTAYLPGEQPSNTQTVVKLNTNENPYPPSPAVEDAINKEVGLLNLYPNPSSCELRKEIASLNDLSPREVIVGNGSDDLLNLCVRCFSDDDLSVGMLYPSYSLYEVLTGIQGSKMIKVSFDDNEFSLCPEKISSSAVNLFFLTNPHAPSGRCYALEELREVLRNYQGLLVIDEAYADFAPYNARPLLNEFDNLIITRTFSKSYSLAGLRVGYALGNSKIIEELDKVREVYNVDRLAQVGAVAALKDRSYFKNCLAKVMEQRDFMESTFKELKWPYIPSGANFIFVKPLDPKGNSSAEIANSLFGYLRANNILVRYFPKHPLTSSFIRISIGKPSEMSMLKDKIRGWIEKEK